MSFTENNFTWKDAYKTFAIYLLTNYKNKPEDLYKAIVTNCKDVLPDSLLQTIEKGDCTELDPFTVMGLFNRHWDDQKRIDIFTKVGNALGFSLDKEITGFSGVPVPGHGHEVFSKQTEKDKTGKTDKTNKQKLWQLFQAALFLADESSTDESQGKKDFTDSYDQVLALTDVKWNLSMALFWIRPDYYLTLDSNVRPFLSDTKNVPEEIANRVSTWVTPPKGNEYLALVGELKEEMSKPGFAEKYGYTDFAKLSDKAYKASLYSVVVDILKHNGQIILHGAPGTGKTFLAEKTIAPLLATPDMVDGKIKHIHKVQFHPGYDYSDFIVGMKPMLVSEATCNEVVRRDGQLVELIPTKVADQGNHESSTMEYEEHPFNGKVQQSFRWKDGIFKQIVDEAKRALDQNPMDPEKFVLIIDEINRADLSNVFGEVFSCIERGYRYRYNPETGKPDNAEGITLPSGEQLVVPDNLYIIGTMNDIDRSVESIDFALRRRFAWKEIEAAKTKNDILGAKDFDYETLGKLSKAMDNLNAKIREALDKGHELGAAYFANLELYKNDEETKNAYGDSAFKSLWDNHLATILTEYLRGQNIDEKTLDNWQSVYEKAVGIKKAEKQG